MKQEPCPYCRTSLDVETIETESPRANITILDKSMLFCVSIDYKVLAIETIINYCPMCGRKLEDV
jgi:hypothetical protein